MTAGLYTADQAEPIVHVPASTIRRWRRDDKVHPAGNLPSRGRHGRVDLFTLTELEPEADRYHADPHRSACRWCGGGRHAAGSSMPVQP